MAKSKADEILRAEKERDFRRSIEKVEGFFGWEHGKGSHVKAVFKKGEGEDTRYPTQPYAAHGGEVSKGVRRSFVRWLKEQGFIILLLLFAGLAALATAMLQ